jgi:HD-GYP domain-containing protein (c-di-GMP phosphodiesterase class II)
MKNGPAMLLYVTSVAVAALGAMVSTLWTLGATRTENGWLFVAFFALAVLAELYATRIPAFRMELSSSVAIYLATLFIYGLPMALIVVVASSTLSECLLRRPLRRSGRQSFAIPVAFNVGQLALSICAAGAVLILVGEAAVDLSTPRQFAVALASFTAYVGMNHALVTGAVALSSHRRFFPALWRGIAQFGVQYTVLCTAAMLLTVLHGVSMWYVLLALVPLTLVHVSFRGWVRLQTEARRTFERISRLLDQRDHDTAVHSEEVARLAVRLGEELGLSESQLERLDIAARVHDIGKMAIPDAILLKPGPLTPREWETMKSHSSISAELIEGLEIYAAVAPAVRHEHERWDGRGYPDGLKGGAIPLLSRVIAAADIYCALITDRPYRPAFSPEAAQSMLHEMRGRELDPRIADALLGLLRGSRRLGEAERIAEPNEDE